MTSWLFCLQAGVYSTIPGEPQHEEAGYSQVDKRSSQKKLISQTSSDKQKSWDNYRTTSFHGDNFATCENLSDSTIFFLDYLVDVGM